MQEYFIRSFMYFIVLMALCFLMRSQHSDIMKRGISLKGVFSTICFSLVPFVRFLWAVLLAIVVFIPSSKLEKLIDKEKEKESIDLRKQYKG